MLFQDTSTRSKDPIVKSTTAYPNHSAMFAITIKSEPPSPISSATPAVAPVALQVREAYKPEPVNLLEEVPAESTRTKTMPKFHLSVMTPQEKIDYSALIEELGGTVFDSVYFNPDCSHVVIGKPNRFAFVVVCLFVCLFVYSVTDVVIFMRTSDTAGEHPLRFLRSAVCSSSVPRQWLNALTEARDAIF